MLEDERAQQLALAVNELADAVRDGLAQIAVALEKVADALVIADPPE
jgi:hypothetical protein